MTRAAAVAVVVAMSLAAVPPAAAQGSPACQAIVQAAADGMAARIRADDEAIPAPQSVRQLTCLDGFFNGTGFNVVTDLLNPGQLLSNISAAALRQACSLARQAWDAAVGNVQCGLTITGFNLGFGGLTGGLFCPRLSFGGGGAALGGASLGAGTRGARGYIPGQAMGPNGYVMSYPLGMAR